MSRLEDFIPLIEEKLQTMGFDLYECKFIPAGKHSILRIFIDKPRGVTVDDCGRASEALSLLLDVEEFSSQPYTLEVSSPGMDRPLKVERDFKRVIGETITVWFTADFEGKKNLSGVLVACESNAIKLDLGDKTADIPLSLIQTGRVDF
jgi:ribosome maturation factor RimP